MKKINNIKTTNEYGLITTINNNSLKTKIEWNLPKEKVEYMGTIPLNKITEK